MIVWARVNTFINIGGIICYGPDGIDYETYSLNTYNSPNRVSFKSNWPGTWYTVSTQSSLNTNIWYHFAATFVSGNSKIYLNGALNNSSTWGITTLPLASARILRIGENQPGGDEYFNGIIDEVRIYNRALSDQEIKALYEATK